jgi:hypothetical protein
MSAAGAKPAGSQITCQDCAHSHGKLLDAAALSDQLDARIEHAIVHRGVARVPIVNRTLGLGRR